MNLCVKTTNETIQWQSQFLFNKALLNKIKLTV